MTSLKTRAAVTLALGALLCGGCGMLKKKQADPAASATPLVAAPALSAAPPAPAATADSAITVADEAVPTPEDFEDEAFEKVSDKTYKAELASLKKEIEAK